MTRLRIIASAVAGLLLAAIAAAPAAAQGTVPFQVLNAKTADYTFLGSDCSKIIAFSSTGALSATLAQAGVTFFTGCYIDVKNIGTAAVTITPTTSTIDGRSSVILAPGAGIRIVNDSANYWTQQFPLVGQRAEGTGFATIGNTRPACTAGSTPNTWLRFSGTDGSIWVVPAWSGTGC